MTMMPSRQPGSVPRYGGRRQGNANPSAHPGRSRLPARFLVGALAAILLVGSAVHLAPAIKAGLHEGTGGSWVATGKTCSKSACVWNGKFVLADGQVRYAKTQFSGQLPDNLHAGTSLPALDTGESGLVFPAAGSDLWISLLVALILSALALYWAARKPLLDYLRDRRETAALAAGNPPPS
jgi:hypothetical protein